LEQGDQTSSVNQIKRVCNKAKELTEGEEWAELPSLRAFIPNLPVNSVFIPVYLLNNVVSNSDNIAAFDGMIRERGIGKDAQTRSSPVAIRFEELR
jgi:hypothetical protein